MKYILNMVKFLIGVIGVATTALIVYLLLGHFNATTNFVMVLSLMRQQSLYAERMDVDTMLQAATAGLVNVLDDPYSVYLDEEQTAAIKQHYEAEFGGIGVYLSQYDDGRVVIIAPIPGTPGDVAGLQPGDIITTVNGESTSGMSLNDVTAQVQGDAGTQVTIGVFRETDRQEHEYTIIREIIDIPSVSSEELEDGIGYIHITHFTAHTPQEVVDSVNELNQAAIDGLIIDLRANPGGELDAAVNVANIFLDGKKIVSMSNTKGDEVVHHATGGSCELPLVVLIDGNSASSSEILAGALRDNDRALLVGEQSFGKGLVQNVYPLQGERSLKLTTDKYYTPNGTDINEVGISPDYIVAPAAGDEDVQLEEAIEVLKQEML
ncbi:MAG: S41 family peptidase [Syntrophomonadaceae bacterium]|nr:S41 family peptidase [Syntrophomonadaceae bacterium]